MSKQPAVHLPAVVVYTKQKQQTERSPRIQFQINKLLNSPRAFSVHWRAANENMGNGLLHVVSFAAWDRRHSEKDSLDKKREFVVGKINKYV